VLRKGKVYPLSREEREEVREFIQEQLRKGYIWPSKSQEQLPTPIDIGRPRKHWDKEGVYEDGPEVGIQQHED